MAKISLKLQRKMAKSPMEIPMEHRCYDPLRVDFPISHEFPIFFQL